ncbi:ISXoo3 transposase orfB [Xanthomonas oryzae pv. oryzae MAFF 311018]|nr:ISXoo3 transposase orfB [Xanthomonas oryzae pv. oryzae MAFF 311018]
MSAPARRALVREWIDGGASERCALAAIGMSASALRYRPREDRNVELREHSVALAHRHRRYDVGMISLKLRQEGRLVNYKRVERLYCEQQLQVRRRTRKKVPVGERAPLLRPTKANPVWSMDVVFDRTAEGRVIKCLVIVDDATHQAVAIEVEHAISGHRVARVLDRLAHSGGLPQVIRTDNGHAQGWDAYHAICNASWTSSNRRYVSASVSGWSAHNGCWHSVPRTNRNSTPCTRRKWNA